MKPILVIAMILIGVALLSGHYSEHETILFHDNFCESAGGDLSTRLGAETEYHFLSESAPKGKWSVSNDRGWWRIAKTAIF